MKKTILYRFLRLGPVPKKLLPVLEKEGIIVLDEGMGGWFVTKHVNGPGKRYRYRSEGFSGCLVITKVRLVCYTYWKRQINYQLRTLRSLSCMSMFQRNKDYLFPLSHLLFVKTGGV